MQDICIKVLSALPALELSRVGYQIVSCRQLHPLLVDQRPMAGKPRSEVILYYVHVILCVQVHTPYGPASHGR